MFRICFLTAEVQTRNRFVFLAVLAVGMVVSPAAGRAAEPEQTINRDYVTAARKSVDMMSALVEHLQDDSVEELAGVKEKTLFRLADQTQHELELLDKALTAKNPTRQDLYKQFDSVDRKVAALVKATADLSPKRPTLQRGADRVRVQNDDLHFLLSAGDGTKERERQVLVRQARSMKTAAKQFAAAAEYAILERPGGTPFIDAVKKLAEQCETFEKSAGEGNLDQCKKDFSTLTDTWGQVVRGFLLLSPREDYHIVRLGFRVDQYHLRLFELLKIPGKRPQLTMNL